MGNVGEEVGIMALNNAAIREISSVGYGEWIEDVGELRGWQRRGN
jgi:hypothetical protein